MIMMPYGRCRSSLQLTGTQTSGTPQDADPATGQRRWTDRTFVYSHFGDAELGYAVTVAPKQADPVPGPRPAPELARYDKMSAERAGVPAPAPGPVQPGTALACWQPSWTMTASSSRPPRPAPRACRLPAECTFQVKNSARTARVAVPRRCTPRRWCGSAARCPAAIGPLEVTPRAPRDPDHFRECEL